MTDSASALRQVTAWFDTVGTAGLQLPNGWFGRPYDNRHELTWSQARPHKLLLELDAQLLLVLADPGEPTTEGRDLIVPFGQLVFDWQGYGDLQNHADLFRRSSLTFVDLRLPAD